MLTMLVAWGFVFILLMLIAYIIRVKRGHRKNYSQLKNQFIEFSNNTQDELITHIYRELHDNVGQLLTTARLQLFVARREKFKEKDALIKTAIANIASASECLRQLTSNVRNKVSIGVSLQNAIENLIEEINIIGQIKVEYEVKDKMYMIDPHKSVMIFRMLQEAINNIITHSEADTATIIVDYNPSLFCLTIKDNGIGFDVNGYINNSSTRRVSGLDNLYSRAKLIDASLNIVSNPNLGTEISIKLPNLKNA